jgi:hypothetical protein
MTKGRRGLKLGRTLGAYVLGASSLMGCVLSGSADGKGKGPDLSDIELPDIDTDDLKEQAIALLRSLFPDLSVEEVSEISGSLSLSEVLALKDELEAARDAAREFADKLITTAEESVQQRKQDLAPLNDGFPVGLEAVGKICTYDAATGRGEVRLSGVFNGKNSVTLNADAIKLSIDGVQQQFSLGCFSGGPSVDVVFLVDITGSMTNVIDSVRDSVVNFVDILEASGVAGTVSVVTFQDTVGVNRTFQEPEPPNDFERSPFFAPVSLADAAHVDELRGFVNRLEANRGADAPENLAGAVDFARNNVIGTMANGQPNVIGDGQEDPAATEAFPALQSDRQVFVALTDITFHGQNEDQRSSSLRAEFVPRDTSVILDSLHRSGTTIHVSDPSWADASVNPGANTVDADYWAIHTGGLGEDRVAGYSLVDLELVVVAEKTGLLDITLDKIISSSCTLEFEAQLSATAQLSIDITVEGAAQYTSPIEIERF